MIITHANRSLDLNHTSWAEIAAFHSIYEKEIDYAQLIDCNEILNQCQNKKLSDITQHLIIFITGRVNKELKEKIIESQNKLKVYFVVEDPNWPTYIDFLDFYYLITPFRLLHNKSCEDIKKVFNELTPNYKFKGEFEHIFIPFGNMMHESEFYIQQYKNNQYYPVDIINDQCYLGSLKEDRKLAFRIAVQQGTDFYGNYTNQQLAALLNIEDINSSICKGKTINPYVVPVVYSQYKKAVYMPDIKMITFDSCYLRTNELAIAQVDINPTVNSYDIKDHLEKLTTNNKFDAKKIINEYGLVSDHLNELKRRL